MGWWGRALGTVIGGLAGGPAGATAGFGIGGELLPFKRGGRVRSRMPPRTKSGRFRKRK